MGIPHEAALVAPCIFYMILFTGVLKSGSSPYRCHCEEHVHFAQCKLSDAAISIIV